MKKKIMLFAMMIILIITGIYAYSHFNKEDASIHTISKEVTEEIQKKNMLDELINIDECSEEFMEEYFEGMNEIQEIDNKENLVLIVSNEDIKEDYGATKVVKGPNNKYFLQYDSEEERKKALVEFEKNNNIISVEENKLYKLSNFNSWGVTECGMDYAIESAEGKNLNDVIVAILDTGCNIEVMEKYYPNRIIGTYNTGDASNPSYDVIDENGHGTHIAGTIAECTPKNVKILPIKIEDENGEMWLDSILEALDYITRNDAADVINMSYGDENGEISLFEYQAIEAANKKNIISVAAAGNESKNVVSTPAAYDNTIAISSVNKNLKKSEFSNYGEEITFTAPGEEISSIVEEFCMSGTSMATPHAVSAVAILKSYNKDLTLENTIELLKRYAIDLGEEGHDEYYGYGLINFKGTEFYDGENGDEFNVFKNYIKAEIPELKTTEYNYGNLTNLMNAEVRFYYNENDYYTKEFWELDNLEITGYNPNQYTTQTINVRYEGNDYEFKVDNTNFAGIGWEYTKDFSGNLTITGFLGKIPPKIYIPNQIDGYSVTKLGDDVFIGESIKDAIVPEGITEIGSAFAMCYELENVVLPTSLTKIGDNTFYDNSNLKSLEIPPNVNTIGESAFYYTSIKTIDIPGSVTSIGENAFLNCIYLSEVILNDGLIEIGNNAFVATSINEITIPDTVKKIGSYAFYYNPFLTSAIIGKNVEEIGEGAFRECYELSNIELSPKLKKINSYVFAYNYMLKEVTIPGSVERIETEAFIDDTALIKINIEEGVKRIANSAFYLYGDVARNIESENTKQMPKALKFHNKVEEEKELYNNDVNELVEYREVNMPKTIEKIGNTSFYNGTDLEYRFYVFTDTKAHEHAKNQNIKYICKDPNEVIAYLNKTEYKAFETVDCDDLYLKLKYEDGRIEEIRENINIQYINGEYLRGIDTYFTASAYNEYNEFVEKQVAVTVKKLTPNFEVPTDLVGEEGQTLSEVLLPDEFEWKNPDTIITDEETLTFDAIYTPEDTDNYEIVSDVKITISVRSRSPEKPEQVSIEGEYIYNGEEQTAVVTGFDSETMNIEGNKQTDAGVHTIKITSKTGKWSDRTKDPICLEWTINKKEIEVPKFTTIDIQWDGEEHSVIENLDNKFNDELMEIEGITKATKSGKYSFEIKLKDSNNYKWQDNIEKVEFEWEISKVQIIPNITVKEKVYDGTNVLSNDNITISNLDSKDYTIISAILDSENIGHTKVKIKIRLSDEKFENYMLDNKLQEAEYTLNIEVKAIKLLKPTKVNKVYTYNGKEQQIELNNFDADKMSIKNNTRKNAGKQTVVVALKNSNYAWEDDNTQNDLEFNFEIEKAQIIITPDNITAKVGNAIPVIDKKAYTISGAFEENIVIPNLKISYEEEPDMTKEGIYNIVVTGDTEIENYKITYNTGTLTITNKDVQTITFKDKSSKTYGDEAFVNEVEGVLSTKGIKYSSSNEDVAIIDANGKITIKGIGTTIIKAIALEDNNYAEAIATYELVVNKLKLTKPTITKAYIYNEKEQTAEIDNNNSKYITVEGNKGKNAGEYLAIAKLIDKVNVSWEDETIDDIEIVWNIAKADPQITIPTDLWAIIGDNLEDIQLGEGFSWQENAELILGTEEYLAIYTPEDTDNYNIIENIPIKILTKMYNIEWLKDEKYTVIIEADYELFKHVVRVDGKEIEEDVDYISKEGSTKIILQEAFIDTLAPGEHTLEVDFKNGVVAKTTFKIAAIEDDNKENTDNTEEKVDDTSKDTSEYVKTGDSIKPIFVLLAISTLVFVITKKQLNKTKYKK